MQVLKDCIKAGDSAGVTDNLNRLLEQGLRAEELLHEMIGSLREVGDAFSRGDAFIPEMLIAAQAMQTGADILKPILAGGRAERVGRFMIGTVAGDLHDVGKNLVSMLFGSNGFEVVDLGVDVGLEKLITAYDEHQPDLVGLSALLTTTMGAMEKAVAALKEKHPACRVIVGGAPITGEFAERIGADGYAADAAGAVELARRLLTS